MDYSPHLCGWPHYCPSPHPPFTFPQQLPLFCHTHPHTHTPTHTRSQWETCPNSGWLGGPTCELLGLSVRRAEHIFNLTCLPIRGPFPAARGCKPERPQAYYMSQRFSKRLRTPRYLSFSHICPAGSGVKASPIRVVDVSLTLWCQDTGPQILQ